MPSLQNFGPIRQIFPKNPLAVLRNFKELRPREGELAAFYKMLFHWHCA
jgi:hypothetical protein